MQSLSVEPIIKIKKMQRLAEDVLNMSKSSLLLNMRFLDIALDALTPAEYQGTFATDGMFFYYSPAYILDRYKDEHEGVARAYLHCLLHCIFRHMFVAGDVDAELWNIACDIHVEMIINSLDLVAVQTRKKDRQKYETAFFETKVGTITAERVYNYLKKIPYDGDRLAFLSDLFYEDDHEEWHKGPNTGDDEGGQGDYSSMPERRSESDVPSADDGPSDKGGEKHDYSMEIADKWSEIANTIQTDLETFSSEKGKDAGALVQNLRLCYRQRYDYASFLRKFASKGEVLHINDDEFDYIYYTYGLSLYKDLPLIEPLEYKDDKKIKNFVIALDTSASVKGSVVQSFVNKTYNILKSTENFFRRVDIHIIQCDADIQEDYVIHDAGDFEKYLRDMKIKGLGGTDFRPVFNHIEELRSKGEMQKPGGLIYFTDGFGDFPAKMPDYPCAFIYLEHDITNPEIPPWAMKLVLSENEIDSIEAPLPGDCEALFLQ